LTLQWDLIELQHAVIASEAKQSRSHNRKLDCFVASLLAMTWLDRTLSHPALRRVVKMLTA